MEVCLIQESKRAKQEIGTLHIIYFSLPFFSSPLTWSQSDRHRRPKPVPSISHTGSKEQREMTHAHCLNTQKVLKLTIHLLQDLTT